MTALLDSLSAVADDLRELNRPFALVGGLAVSLRADPRFTRDADLVVSVDSDAEAEMTINALLARGYSVLLSHDEDGRRQDLIDLDELKAVASDEDWLIAASACELITSRGFNRNRALTRLLAELRS
jgi:hypothetical protein